MNGAAERRASQEPRRQRAADEPRDGAVGRMRGRCAWWLSGQCKGDGDCTCLPRTPAAEPEPAEPSAGTARRRTGGEA